MPDPLIQVFRSPEELTEAAAGRVVSHLGYAIRARGSATWVLAGGSTPRMLYKRLAEEPFRSGLDWSSVRFLFGDERCVPPDHPDSNFGTARDALLASLGPPPENIARIRGEAPPEASAWEYTNELKRHLAVSGGRADLVLLGLGEDGHTASLFPGTEAVDVQTEGAFPVFVPRLHTWRITLTLPVINAARAVLFLVSGAAKQQIIRKVFETPEPDRNTPATLVRPADGTLTWMLDAAADPAGVR